MSLLKLFPWAKEESKGGFIVQHTRIAVEFEYNKKFQQANETATNESNQKNITSNSSQYICPRLEI